MLEVSLVKLENCIQSLEEQTSVIRSLIQRMEHVYADFDGLLEDKSDRKAIQFLIEDLENEKRNLIQMRESLAEILHCYRYAERRILDSPTVKHSRNLYGLRNLTKVSQMLDDLNILFK